MTAKRRLSLPFFALLSLLCAVSTGCPTTPDSGAYGEPEDSGNTPPNANNLQPGGSGT